MAICSLSFIVLKGATLYSTCTMVSIWRPLAAIHLLVPRLPKVLDGIVGAGTNIVRGSLARLNRLSLRAAQVNRHYFCCFLSEITVDKFETAIINLFTKNLLADLNLTGGLL